MTSTHSALFTDTSDDAAEAQTCSLAAILAQCGFDVQSWKGERIYLSGYGQSVRAYLTPPSLPGGRPCDGAGLVVTSFWKSAKSALHAKGVKHAILKDLHTAGLMSERPPARWQDVSLDAAPAAKRHIRPFVECADDYDAGLTHDQII